MTQFKIQLILKLATCFKTGQPSLVYVNAKHKHLGCKKGEANQKQQLSEYSYNR